MSLDANLAGMIESCKIECSRFTPHKEEVQYQHALKTSLDAVQRIADDIFVSAPSMKDPKKTMVVLEVYAGEFSPLTECLRELGIKAYRFSRKDGDLATPSGRRRLWELIDEIEPDHIFVAPECGPWSGWNHLNAQKSLALWDYVHSKQESEKVHIHLCAQLCKYQQKRHRHFHLEQPLGSSMINTNEFEPIAECSKRVCFDMCAFGLKLPKTSKFIKKRSQLWTTSPEVQQFLMNKDCPKNHEHVQIAGSMHHDGKSVRISSFCATYCQGFVQALAQALCATHLAAVQEAFANDEEPPAKRPRFAPDAFKKRRVAAGQGRFCPLTPCGMKPSKWLID